jgi:hypothetical protein
MYTEICPKAGMARTVESNKPQIHFIFILYSCYESRMQP